MEYVECFKEGLNGEDSVGLSKHFLVGIDLTLTGVRTGCFSGCLVVSTFVTRNDLVNVPLIGG